MKNLTGPTINARFWDRIYQWIYRHNMSEWDIASSCEMKKNGFANFSSSLDEIANLKNDKTWGVLTRWCQKRTVVQIRATMFLVFLERLFSGYGLWNNFKRSLDCSQLQY